MNEIRVINGLHRGVSLPLDGEEIIVGSSLEADIALVDPGVADEHIIIRTSDKLPPDCWEMEIINENTKNQKGKKISGSLTVRLNERINAGGIWLLISDEKEAWPCNEDINAKKPVKKPEKVRNTNFWVKMYCLAAGVLVGIVTLTHAGGDGAGAPEPIETSKSLSKLGMDGYLIDANKEDQPVRQYSSEDLMGYFKKMLKERDLQSINIDVRDDHWTLTGNLAPYDFEKLSRMKIRFMKKYKSDLEIDNNVQKIEQSLPFEISKVISGPMGHIESDDGYKLYIGNEYKGFKLVGITKDTIMFSGKNTIEVKW